MSNVKIDLELLEAAAKVAGVKYDPNASKPHPKSGAFWGLWLTFDREPNEYDRRYWNPLTDDGDALRLAVKLKLKITIGNAIVMVESRWPTPDAGERFDSDDEAASATRRAIVRAAAAMAEESPT
jgi:hypothetical protein